MSKMKTVQNKSNITVIVTVLLALWFALVSLFLGYREAFIGQPETPPLLLLAGTVLPIIVFLVAFRTFNSFRDLLLTFDFRLAAGIQAWRWAGFGFLHFRHTECCLKCLPYRRGRRYGDRFYSAVDYFITHSPFKLCRK